MTQQKNVTNPYYYVGKYDRIMGKLWLLATQTTDIIKLRRCLKNAHKANKALDKYVSVRLYGYQLRQ